MNTTPPKLEGAARSFDWVNMRLSGYPHAVEEMIHLLHQRNIIAASEWSSPTIVYRNN